MVDIQPQTQQPISDDQELAKVLAGVTQQADANMEFEETPMPTSPTPPANDSTATDDTAVQPTTDPVAMPEPVVPVAAPATFGDGSDLSSVKNEAINELRPLVDKLTLPPEEKFDTYLLLIRSTDDKSLIAPAHAAAQTITDEARRAQALLDIIKEIDFLSNPQQ